MNRRNLEPAYLRIASMLRADIAGGRFGAGDRLPSETQLMLRHGVSRSVAKWAFGVLKADGLVEGRQGAGVFVRMADRVPVDPFNVGPDLRTDLVEEVRADRIVATRLALMPGELVIHTRACSRPVDGPIQLVEMWKRAADPRGLAIDRCQDRVSVRPATPAEIVALELPSRGAVIVITRRRMAGRIPVEAIDIVSACDRIELVYEVAEGV